MLVITIMEGVNRFAPTLKALPCAPVTQGLYWMMMASIAMVQNGYIIYDADLMSHIRY